MVDGVGVELELALNGVGVELEWNFVNGGWSWSGVGVDLERSWSGVGVDQYFPTPIQLLYIWRHVTERREKSFVKKWAHVHGVYGAAVCMDEC